MQIHLISGFLGSGKTTAIKTACDVLVSTNKKVAVVTNDQGIRLVDSGFFNSLSIPNRQVVNGCFCCNYNVLDTVIQSLIEANDPDVIFAESVGSCTDIVATVMKPLQQFHNDIQVTVSAFADVRLLQMVLNENTTLFDETVTYIYNKQLEEAGVIVVNKTDTINDDELPAVKQLMQKKFPGKQLLFINSLNANSISEWLLALQNSSADKNLPSLQINYDTYGAGEAMLAWLDEELELHCNDAKATEVAIGLAGKIYRKISAYNLPVGHVKFLVNDNIKISYTATAQPVKPAVINQSLKCTLLINARVQTMPHVLQQLVTDAITETAQAQDCKITVTSVSSFQPGYPAPTHRIIK